MSMLPVPISAAGRLELMKLYLGAVGKLARLPELEGSASAVHRRLPLRAGVSVISVANLYDAFTLGCDNGTYTSHFEDAFY